MVLQIYRVTPGLRSEVLNEQRGLMPSPILLNMACTVSIYTSCLSRSWGRRSGAARWSFLRRAAMAHSTQVADKELEGEATDTEDIGHTDLTSAQGVDETNSPTWRWRLIIAYDGTKYSGWQRQEQFPTVQMVIEDALIKLTRLTRIDLKLMGAGRTDAGVHAWGQVAHFTTFSPFDELAKVHVSLNGILPHDIRIRELSAVHPKFHARYSALSKTYHYKAYVSPVMDPFQRGHAHFLMENLNLEVMLEACRDFLGEHDFSAFANASSDTALEDPVRTILKFDINAVGQNVLFEVEGTGFFYKQVRNMVGLLIEIGKEVVPPRAVRDVINSKSRIILASVARTAPPHGLYLMSVKYDEAFAELIPRASHGKWKVPLKAALYTLSSKVVDKEVAIHCSKKQRICLV